MLVSTPSVCQLSPTIYLLWTAPGGQWGGEGVPGSSSATAWLSYLLCEIRVNIPAFRGLVLSFIKHFMKYLLSEVILRYAVGAQRHLSQVSWSQGLQLILGDRPNCKLLITIRGRSRLA